MQHGEEAVFESEAHVDCPLAPFLGLLLASVERSAKK